MPYNIIYFADLVGDADLYRTNPRIIASPLEILFNRLDKKSPEIVLINGIVFSGNPDNIYSTLTNIIRKVNPIATLGGGDTFASAQSLGEMFAPFRTINRDQISVYSQGADVGEPEERTHLVKPPVGFFSDPRTPPNVMGYTEKPHIIQTSRNIISEGKSWARETLDTFLAKNQGITVLERNPQRTLDETCIVLRDGNLYIEGTSFGSGRFPGTFVVMKIQPGKYVMGNIAQVIPKRKGGYKTKLPIVDFEWDTKDRLELTCRETPIEYNEYNQMLR